MSSNCETTTFVRNIEPGFTNRDFYLLSTFSSTLLSTNRLNKLFHLTLSALVHPDTRLFNRAMLLLHNDRTSSLQGMLGVTSEDAEGLQIVASSPDNPLTGHWELDDSVMQAQMNSEYCSSVRSLRLGITAGCNVVAQTINRHEIFHVKNAECLSCKDCLFLKRFSIRSFAAAPLVTRNRTLGVLIVHNSGDDAIITAEQLHLFQLFALQTAMAMENSQLYKQLEETHNELRESRQRVLHSAHLAAVGEMAASISHELKTPLVTIGGFAARLGRTIPLDAPQRHYLDTIISESHRLERLLADILSYSRKPTICYTRCNLVKILEECLDDYAVSFEENGIKLNREISSGCHDVVGDPHQIKQIFINLLVNAQEAMRSGGVMDVRFSTDQFFDKIFAIIQISDTGEGIPEDNLAKIFTPFFTTKRHGTGLGLAIVNRIIQNHGGTLTAANSDSGAVFTVSLPLAADAAELSET